MTADLHSIISCDLTTWARYKKILKAENNKTVSHGKAFTFLSATPSFDIHFHNGPCNIISYSLKFVKPFFHLLNWAKAGCASDYYQLANITLSKAWSDEIMNDSNFIIKIATNRLLVCLLNIQVIHNRCVVPSTCYSCFIDITHQENTTENNTGNKWIRVIKLLAAKKKRKY